MLRDKLEAFSMSGVDNNSRSIVAVSDGKRRQEKFFHTTGQSFGRIKSELVISNLMKQR
jgi:hypothetical protein